MIIKMKTGANEAQIKQLLSSLEKKGFEIHSSFGETYQVYGVVGDTSKFDIRSLYAYECVGSVVRIQEPFKKVNRKLKSEDSVIDVGGIAVGGKNMVVIAGPCSVESLEQVEIIAKAVKESGATMLRGGAYKPRTSPYSYQGMGLEGLQILKSVGDKYNLSLIHI